MNLIFAGCRKTFEFELNIEKLLFYIAIDENYR